MIKNIIVLFVALAMFAGCMVPMKVINSSPRSITIQGVGHGNKPIAQNLAERECQKNGRHAIHSPDNVRYAIATFEQMGFDSRPFIFAVAFAASASFITPVGYQTNLMVYGPGGYKFSDFIRVGFPLAILFWVSAIILLPMIWPV